MTNHRQATDFTHDPQGQDRELESISRVRTSEQTTELLSAIIAEETCGLTGARPEQDDLDLAQLFVKMINSPNRFELNPQFLEKMLTHQLGYFDDEA